MDAQSIELIRSIATATVTFAALYFDLILAAFIFILGFSLLRTGLSRLPAKGTREAMDYARSVGPGAAFVSLSVFVLAVHDPLLLALFVLVLTVAAGFGFLGVGYRLLVRGLFQVDDRESVWSDHRLLIERALPGLALGVVGVIMIANVLLSAPETLRGYGEERLDARIQMAEVVDARLTDLFTVLAHPADGVEETIPAD